MLPQATVSQNNYCFWETVLGYTYTLISGIIACGSCSVSSSNWRTLFLDVVGYLLIGAVTLGSCLDQGFLINKQRVTITMTTITIRNTATDTEAAMMVVELKVDCSSDPA